MLPETFPFKGKAIDRMISHFLLKVRRRETPFYDRIYRVGKWGTGRSIPCVGPFHRFLYRERSTRRFLWDRFWKAVYYEPLFKSQCESVGKGFRILHGGGDGIPYIDGQLSIVIGDNVSIQDKITIAGLKVLDHPRLTIGDNTYIGPNMLISVGSDVSIGKNCMIASKIVTDNPGHPMVDVMSRIERGVPYPIEIRAVHIGDYVWLATDTFVYPGVTIGDGVFACPGAHIHFDVPPFCVVVGNPAKIKGKLPIPRKIKELVGEQRYQAYLEAHKNLKL